MFTAGSLFSGIGGIDLAFSLAGFDILFQVEIDEFCQKVLKKHSKEYWPNAEIFTDVRAVGSGELPRVDVLFGGFPCQDISLAGNGIGLEGSRSGLWWEFARIIGEIRPRVVLLENVSAIALERRGGTEVIAALASMGYSARWGIIAASDAGAPHQRNRWFCVAYSERRGLLQTPAASNTTYQQIRNTKAKQFAGRALSSEAKPNRSLLRKETGMAYTDSKRFKKNRGYRVEARKRAISTGKVFGMVNTNREGLAKRGLSGGNEAEYSQDNHSSSVHRGNTIRPESRMGRKANGLSSRLDGNRLMNHLWPAKPNEMQYADEPPRSIGIAANRANRVKALGNAVVPQVVLPIALEIKKLLDDN